MGRTTELRLTAVFLLGAAAVAWLVTVDRMQGMDAGPGTDLGGFGWFAGVWAVMMAAMMLPSLLPMAGAYAAQARGGAAAATPRSVTRTTLFVAGYLLAWVIAGVVAWIVFREVRSLDLGFLSWDGGGRYVAAGVIAGAALLRADAAEGQLPAALPRRGPCSSPTGAKDRPEPCGWAWGRGCTASVLPGR